MWETCLAAWKVGPSCPQYCDSQYELFGASYVEDELGIMSVKSGPIKLVWLSRISGMLSFLGASYILYDVLSSRKNRRTVYHQLVFGMALFDIVSGVIFATLPMWKDQVIELAHEVHGARGTEFTCKLQGFFVQLGFTSVFYNLSLTVYYLLVIVYGWGDFRVKR